ncbi:MAG: pilus assembly protein N-terminal domain-containing protein [Acidobacteriaceae bacterium]
MKVRSSIPVIALCVLTIVAFSAPAITAQSTEPSTAPPRRDSSRDLSVAVGKTAVIDFSHSVKRVAVGLGDIAEASAVSPTEILVNGKTPGVTSLIVWETTGQRQFFNVTVHASLYASQDKMLELGRELHMQLPGQDVSASTANGLIFLRGTVKNLDSSNRAAAIAATMGKVVNLLYVDVPQSPAQILLKVRFCSVDRSLERQLGINLYSLGAANSVGAVTTGQFTPPSVSLPTSGSTASAAAAIISNALNLSIFRPDLNLGATLEALENKGVVEVLAQPNVIAQDGKQASFLAGGEYPFPVVQGVAGGAGGAVTIEFKEYGVRLTFIPTITPRGTIRLQVAPEVSSLDFTNAVEISGFTVPAIDVRNVNTEVELGNGQSFIIGGLLDNRETDTFEKIPFLGDIPILGKFFQSTSKNRTNTELMVIVTPVIVPPIPAGQPLPALHYPIKFLPSNSNIPMSTPAGNVPAPPQPTTMPVEKLVESNKPEKPLQVQSVTGGSGASSGTSSSMQ